MTGQDIARSLGQSLVMGRRSLVFGHQFLENPGRSLRFPHRDPAGRPRHTRRLGLVFHALEVLLD